MRFRFTNKDLKALHSHEKCSLKYAPGVVDAFLDVMSAVQAASDERDLRKGGGLHFEKLSGDRQGQYSMRLNKQYRLIVMLEEDSQGCTVAIHEIVDYH